MAEVNIKKKSPWWTMENFEVVGHCDFVQGELELVRSN